jgi:hypothetical protein
MQTIKLDQIINNAIDELGGSNHDYFRLWNIAYRGMQDMGLDIFFNVKSIKIPIESNKTAKLPIDFLQWSKIGVLNSRGEVLQLQYNNNLTTYADTFNDRLSKVEDDTLFNWDITSPIFYNYYGGYCSGNIYGYGSNYPKIGEFKIDNENNLIVLGVNFTGYDYLILEYVCSLEPTNDYHIPAIFEQPLIDWIAWKSIANLPSTRKGNISDKQVRRHEYFNSRRLALARYKPFRINDALNIEREMTRLTIKS